MTSASLLTPMTPASTADGSNSAVTKESLGAHILSEIERCHGPQLPCYSTEQILSGFWERFGADGMAICHQAFTVHDGMWRGAPVTVLRFQPNQDSYFAVPLLAEALGAGRETR
jgi:hypothetical protein